ncbi:MAG: phosphoenolpyruvate carboxykinase domain-containing protein, partial [Candidatus Margulisiibacteriota bacterium]
KEPWWEGLDGPVPKNLTDWQGNAWDPSKEGKAAQPNSRFTVSIQNCPTLSKEYDNPQGVPISAIILGGRRTQLVPLVSEAYDWQNGVFMGARSGSETTSAAVGKEGVLRRDPMAMLPFCGYNMGDYFGHWLKMGKKLKNPPKIFSVNWFRTDDEGKFIWPGFGDNIRVLKWIIDRCEGKVEARKTAVGMLPEMKDLDLSGLNIPQAKMERILSVNNADWRKEA